MESISCDEAARKLLACCLRGAPWSPELLRKLVEGECSDSFFRVVVEGMADRFEPVLCDTYAALFSEAIPEVVPGLTKAELVDRYRRVRRPRKFEGSVSKVFVLSRVTLGADVAVTSVILDGVKRRFPDAQIVFVAPRKNWEMFAADSRIEHLPIAYPRAGTLGRRLEAWHALQISEPNSIVIDPDSRLTQLGLLPICPEENYFFFESRSYGGTGEKPLPELTARWLAETFEIAEARPYIAVLPVPATKPIITVSFGVGDNLAKRIADPFESELLRHLAARNAELWIDKGGGGEEAARVDRAIAGLPARVWEGSFAGFASLIAQSSLYVGYDSAGQHVAAACGVPMLSVFAGFPSLRMFARWRPVGRGPIEIVRVDDPDPGATLRRAMAALDRLS